MSVDARSWHRRSGSDCSRPGAQGLPAAFGTLNFGRRRIPTASMGECCCDFNPFRLCSGLRVLGYSMILLFVAIVAVSYYAVIIVAWGPRLLHGGPLSFLAFTIVIIFHFLLVLLVWSYFMVVFHDPGDVPAGWQPASKETA
ncbi:putative S-acyltransferase [Platanthera guangdongensis]|uniref:S-acyltransferase n=1 Tax=Platanthera guangdongensis TaxID=2320717 RepID=A0ABR2LNG9_9ASPA